MTGKDRKNKRKNPDCKEICGKAAAKLRVFPVPCYLGTGGVLILLALVLLSRNAGKDRKIREMQVQLFSVQIQAKDDASAGTAKAAELETRITELTAAAEKRQAEKAGLTADSAKKDAEIAVLNGKIAETESALKASDEQLAAVKEAAGEQTAETAAVHQEAVRSRKEKLAGLEQNAETVAAEKAAVQAVTAKARAAVDAAEKRAAEMETWANAVSEEQKAAAAVYESMLSGAAAAEAKRDKVIAAQDAVLQTVRRLNEGVYRSAFSGQEADSARNRVPELAAGAGSRPDIDYMEEILRASGYIWDFSGTEPEKYAEPTEDGQTDWERIDEAVSPPSVSELAADAGNRPGWDEDILKNLLFGEPSGADIFSPDSLTDGDAGSPAEKMEQEPEQMPQSHIEDDYCPVRTPGGSADRFREGMGFSAEMFGQEPEKIPQKPAGKSGWSRIEKLLKSGKNAIGSGLGSAPGLSAVLPSDEEGYNREPREQMERRREEQEEKMLREAELIGQLHQPAMDKNRF